ncbi:MAG: N-acetylmuramoyl-L-alanine amidase [Paramuribaculum sp.]|nr:N-acetylmuramoyl-L-alanine amidase [Paramuribaculum sp.]
MRQIDEIIIHCTATPEGRNVTVQQIRDWHVKGNGWADIGYHFIIDLEGKVHPGRPISQPGAHCYGHNAKSIGIVYVGGLASDGKTPKDTRTPAQRFAIRQLVQQLRDQFPGVTVHGHNEYAAKACPSFDVQKDL